MAGATERGEKGEEGAPAVTPGQVVDPTRNVLDLVKAESKYQDGMREAEAKLQMSLQDAERRRQDDLAAQKERYDRQISDILSVQVRTTSDLISTQLEKVTSALGAQIASLTATTNNQITALGSSLTARLDQLDRFRYEMGARTSVTDPATATSLSEMAVALRNLRSSDDASTGKGIGRAEVISYVIGGGMAVLAAATFFLKH